MCTITCFVSSFLPQDMQDISEHVRITAAIACGAALGYRTDWDLTEIIGTNWFTSQCDALVK